MVICLKLDNCLMLRLKLDECPLLASCTSPLVSDGINKNRYQGEKSLYIWCPKNEIKLPSFPVIFRAMSRGQRANTSFSSSSSDLLGNVIADRELSICAKVAAE